MKDLMITHAKDIDGVSPVILLKLCNRKIDYYLLEIDEVEERVYDILGGNLEEYENIYITDLSLSEQQYQWIENRPWKEKIHIFDHHISHNYASNYPYVVIDCDECATSLFFKYLKQLYPNDMNFEKIEQYVEHVLNLDLWYWVEKQDFFAKKLGDLFEIFGNEDYIEHFYQKMLSEQKLELTSLEEKILQIEQRRINRYFKKKNESLMTFVYKNYQVGVVFAESYRSELGMMLQDDHPELDFIAMINVGGGVSLRTQKDNVDLSALAVSLGGGGHKKASGFGITKDLKIEIITKILEGIEESM